LNRWSKDFCHLFNVHGVNNISQTEMHTSEPLVREPSPLEIEIATENLKGYTSPGID